MPPSERRTVATFRRVKLLVINQALEAPPGRAFELSNNEKTGLSINFPIPQTCAPTRACQEYCYALRGRISMDPAVRKQARNYKLSVHLETAPYTEVAFAADALAYDALRTGVDWLRWNGSGDLSRGAVRVLNAALKRHPTLKHWVTTRRFELARKIRDAPNLYLMPSFDGTETPKRLDSYRKTVIRFENAHVREAWVRRKGATHAPPESAFVVFNEHVMHYRSGDGEDPRTCPATVPGGLAHASACVNCKRCFT